MISAFEASKSEEKIRQAVKHVLDLNPATREFDDLSGYNWERDEIPLDDVTATGDYAEESNVALFERRRAVERAQVTVGEGKPLIVLGEDNHLIEGFARYRLLDEHFGFDTAVVYRGRPEADTADDATEIATAPK